MGVKRVGNVWVVASAHVRKMFLVVNKVMQAGKSESLYPKSESGIIRL